MRSLWLRCLLIAVALFSAPALSIVNIEDMRMDESKPGWMLSSTLSLSGKRGNLEEDKLSLNGGTQWISDDLKVRNLLLFTVANDRAEGETYSEEYFAHLRHTRQVVNGIAWELFGQHQSEPLNQDYKRQLIGSNARFRIETALVDGYGGAGLMYEERSVEPPLAEQIERNDWRLNFYLNSSYPLSDNAELAVNFYVQPAIEDFSDVRSVVNAGITSRLNRVFSLTLDVSYSNESEPLVGQAHDEWTYAMGLNFRF
ncbi:hypothetical protein CWE12_00395 [Aliidiomarina sedimenti]|uniref:DUF481 domain-containing protein n=1 Tax=Aliidiomarina sedimenti TaxID=1933879 RepID=A0ABY0C0W4_9GAMM|nr:hypothetical protein CWE12_00395 [Aliidiomarina sedimenti]